jgi:hypothetical protein
MLLFRTKIYNLLNRLMPKEEISTLLNNKYNLNLTQQPNKI